MIKRASFLCLLVVFAVVTSGCATKPQQVDQTFWQAEKKKVAIVLHELPVKGGFYQEGGQGLLDIAIASIVTQKVSKHLSTLKPDSFLTIRETMAERLSLEGFEVVQYDKLINLENFPKKSGDGVYERDLSSIAQETGADQIIVFRMYQFGASRAYYAFIPISAPQGLAVVDGAMIDAKTNKLMWHTGDSLQNSYVKEPVIGEWDEPPTYPHLIAATDRAIDKSKRMLVDKFFSK